MWTGRDHSRHQLDALVQGVQGTLGWTPFPPQLQTAQLLARGTIVELDTGEGKTLAGALGAALFAAAGERVWLATSNDYLARRDADWMRPFYESQGLRAGCVAEGVSQADRRTAYACDVVYGTLREFGFDYLRSRLAERGPAGRRPDAALLGSDPFRNVLLVDEADSLLIDEARTPLIVSRPGVGVGSAHDAGLRWCAAQAGQFRENEDYEPLSDRRGVALTEAGRQRMLSIPVAPGAAGMTLNELLEAVERAIYVNLRFVRDRDYVVRDDRLLIVDEFTGRTSEGRTWSAGIHQALEAREGIPLTPQSRTAAQITIQDFVGRFGTLAGMTGTAQESAAEFRAVYGAGVRRVPPHRPSIRIDRPPKILATAAEKWRAVATEARSLCAAGRAVLVGTRTVEASEDLSAVFKAEQLSHVVLSARVPHREAEIVAQAGQCGRITIATNMAGRGTDIAIDDDVRAAGGLAVIGTELHASSRIDRQLAGRCARQGDPGSSGWYLSRDDEILILAERGAGAAAAGNARRIRLTPAAFRRAQRSVERQHVRDRMQLRLSTAEMAKHYGNLGLDPIVDAVE